MAIINRYLSGFVFLSSIVSSIAYAEDTDITFPLVPTLRVGMHMELGLGLVMNSHAERGN